MLKESYIQEISHIQDYWVLKTNNAVINIYNPFTAYESVGMLNISERNLDALIGCKIHREKINESKEYTLFLENEYMIVISLRDEDYVGPEVLEIVFNSGKTVVFN